MFIQTGAGELTVEEGVGGGASGGAGRRRLLAGGIEGVVVPLPAHVAVVAARVPEVLQEPRAPKGWFNVMGRVNSEEAQVGWAAADEWRRAWSWCAF